MIYVDANVFVLATLDRGRPGEEARSFLKDIQSGKVDACSSSLTFDELVWAVKRNRTPEEAVAAGETLLNMPRLDLVAVDRDLLGRVLGVMKRYQLDPRDSIHVASAMAIEANAIVSSDRHFDRVKEIPRKSVSDARSMFGSNPKLGHFDERD